MAYSYSLTFLEHYLFRIRPLSVCIYLAHRIDLYNNQYDKTIYIVSPRPLICRFPIDMVYICRILKFLYILIKLRCVFEKEK